MFRTILNIRVASFMQGQKKAQSKVLPEHDGPFGSRPGTSSRRPSDKSSNGGYGSASPLNRKLTSINSPSQGISFIKGGKRIQGQRAYNQKGFPHHLREDAISVVSSFSGPFSP